MTGSLESAFDEAMLNIYRVALSECDYNATYFHQMVNESGGRGAAKRLLHAEGFSDGLTRLWKCGRLDISMEALVLKEPWRTLFTDEELCFARTRLVELGFPVDDLDSSLGMALR